LGLVELEIPGFVFCIFGGFGLLLLLWGGGGGGGGRVRVGCWLGFGGRGGRARVAWLGTELREKRSHTTSRLVRGAPPPRVNAIALGPAYTPFAGVYLFSVHANAGATRGRTGSTGPMDRTCVSTGPALRKNQRSLVA